VNLMVVFSFQSIISIQCTVVLANSIYSAECTNIGLFMGYFLYHLVQSVVAISSNWVAAILSLLFSQVVLLFFERCLLLVAKETPFEIALMSYEVLARQGLAIAIALALTDGSFCTIHTHTHISH